MGLNKACHSERKRTERAEVKNLIVLGYKHAKRDSSVVQKCTGLLLNDRTFLVSNHPLQQPSQKLISIYFVDVIHIGNYNQLFSASGKGHV